MAEQWIGVVCWMVLGYVVGKGAELRYQEVRVKGWTFVLIQLFCHMIVYSGFLMVLYLALKSLGNK